MGAESLQHKLDRVRRPRVQITYDVETNGAMKKVELPFVAGVMADLSGMPSQAGTKMAVELNFKHMDDFEPQRVAQQVPALKELLEMRSKITQLMSKMEGNDKLEQLLAQVMTNTS